MGIGPVVAVLMAAVMAVVMGGGHHAIQCSWVAAAAYHWFEMYFHSIQRFKLLHQVPKGNAF